MRLRGGPAMVLWGPQSHWSSDVSFPAVTLARGDRVVVSMLDRNIGRDEALGSAEVKWDGASPLALTSKRWTMSCAILTSDEVMSEAAPWLASLERQLEEVERAPVVREQRDFGYPAHRIELMKGMFKELFTKEGNFRYAAGFVGWGHPEIQSRLARLRAAEESWRTRLVKELEEIATGRGSFASAAPSFGSSDTEAAARVATAE
jgi:hypothetical protein